MWVGGVIMALIFQMRISHLNNTEWMKSCVSWSRIILVKLLFY